MDLSWHLVGLLAISQGLALNIKNVNSTVTTKPQVTSPVSVTSTTVEYEDDEERVTYDGSQVLKVHVKSVKIQQEILKLEELGVLDTWSDLSMGSPTVDVLISPENQDTVKAFLNLHNITYEVAIEDVQKIIDEQGSQMANSTRTPKQGGSIKFNAYHSLEDIYNYFDYLFANCGPCLVRTLGTTAEGRPIKALEIVDTSSATSNPIFVVEGGMHGREWASVSAVLYMIHEVAENFGRFSAVPLFSDTHFYFIPVANPDGYEYSRKRDRLWRKNRRRGTLRETDHSHHSHHSHHSRSHKHNHKHSHIHEHQHERPKRCDGVDLNRNFGYKWGGAGSSGDECKETYRGPSAFSEPETKAIADFIENIETASSSNVVYLSYHSYGQKILYPWSYDRINHDQFPFYQDCGNKMAERMKGVQDRTYEVGAFGPITYPASGTSMDWMIGGAEDKFEVAYTIVLRDTGRFGFLLPAHEILPTGEEALQSLIAFFDC